VKSKAKDFAMKTANGNGANDGRRDRREILRQQIAKLEAKLTQENRREQGQARKRDTQLKILAGAILLADVAAGNTARPLVVEMFKRGARRDRDVKLLQEEGWLK
jgi:hypothetical protein